jgi:hypothetical protein
MTLHRARASTVNIDPRPLVLTDRTRASFCFVSFGRLLRTGQGSARRSTAISTLRRIKVGASGHRYWPTTTTRTRRCDRTTEHRRPQPDIPKIAAASCPWFSRSIARSSLYLSRIIKQKKGLQRRRRDRCSNNGRTRSRRVSRAAAQRDSC